MIIENISLSRRRFLGGVLSTGAFVIASRFVPETLSAQEAIFRTKADAAALHPSVYLGIEPDGTVFIVTHRSEMGTGIRTSLPLVAADELDATWSRVRIEQGVGDTRYGDQNTDGSRSVRDFYDAFRVAGASAKAMLISAAATQWNVPASECSAVNHEIVHAKSGKKIGYGALVPAAAKLPVPAKRRSRSSRRARGSSSARNARFTTSGTSRRARRRSASTSIARAWSSRRSSTRRCSAGRSRPSTTRTR